MFDLEHWREILQNVFRSKMRTFLTSIGVIWGVLIIILMLAGASGLENGIKKNMEGRVANSLYVWGMRTTRPYQGMKAGRNIRFYNHHAGEIQRNVEGAVKVLPRLSLGGYGSANNISRGNKFGSYSVKGDHPDYIEIEPRRVLAGRWLNILDVEEKRKVCVVGEAVVQGLFEEGESPIGQSIDIQGVYFQVVGVFRTLKSDENSLQEDMETIHIPYSTLQQSLTSNPERIGWFAILADPSRSASEVEEEVVAYIKKMMKVSPDDNMAIGKWNMQKEWGKYTNMFKGIKWLVTLVGIGMLIAGVIGVMNIMLIAIKERTREFGIRKAIGAVPMKIITMIMLETLFITVVAGSLGLLLGYLGEMGFEILAENMTQADSGSRHWRRSFVMFAKPSLDINIYYGTFIILVVAGLLAGILPAIRALQINPIKALRSE